MHINDVLNKCKENGYEITKVGLYRIGKKYGFLNKKDGEHHLEFNQEKFFEWLKGATEKIPDGWVSVNELHKKLGISIAQAYILIKDEESGAKRFGSGSGVTYVDPERIKQIIKKREDDYKEKWGE